MTTRDTATPAGQLRTRVAALERLRDRVAEELATAQARLHRIEAPPRRNTLPEGVTTSHVRTWARTQGYTVGDRGQLSAVLVDAYITAHR